MNILRRCIGAPPTLPVQHSFSDRCRWDHLRGRHVLWSTL